jgi:hypothetical protein
MVTVAEAVEKSGGPLTQTIFETVEQALDVE